MAEQEMTKGSSALFQPGRIGVLRVENRIIMSAMGGNRLADDECNVTDSMVDHYRARARGGVGLIVTQCAQVSSDATPPQTLAIHSDRLLPGLSRLVSALHAEGTRVCIQLMHYGMLLSVRQIIPEGMSMKVPSIIPWMPENGPYEQLTQLQIDGYVDDFAEAAVRAKEAGADAVELHACHGCLVGTFLSPVTNRRKDEYGGNAKNRVRFAVQIVERIRAKVGAAFPIIVKINGSDDVVGGVTLDEAVQQSLALECAGVDAISVSAGLDYWSPLTVPPYACPDGVHVPLAEEVKKAVRVPVVTVGKIGLGLAEKIIGGGKADFVAIGRPLLADPELPNKVREGRVEEIRPCLYCNNCLKTGVGHCTVNPFLYRKDSCHVRPATQPKNVMVIGGGLAGMQAASLLAQRGHRVDLYEQETELGGQWNIASMMPGKAGYAAFVDYLKRSLHEYGVRVAVGAKVTKSRVLEMRPDVVVVATGGVPQTLEVPGARQPHVVQANDVIAGRVQAKDMVVVIGGRSIGMEVAVWLAGQGKKASLVTRAGLGEAMEKCTYRLLLRQLLGLRVPLYLDARVLEITSASVVLRFGREIVSLPADTVIMAVGTQPDNKLTKQLKGIVPAVHVVGDCLEARDGATATYEAAVLALGL